MLPLEGDRKPFVFLKTNFDERRGQFSPDGRWVAYQSNESGRYEIYVRPFPGPSSPAGPTDARAGSGRSRRRAGSIRGGGRTARNCTTLRRMGPLMAAPIAVNGATLEPGRAGGAVSHADLRRRHGHSTRERQYDVARDGRFLINTVLDDAASPITLLQNWHPEPGK